jgi:hypothetical protein
VPVVVDVTVDAVGVIVVGVARGLVVADTAGLAAALHAAADIPIRMDTAVHHAPRENRIRTR